MRNVITCDRRVYVDHKDRVVDDKYTGGKRLVASVGQLLTPEEAKRYGVKPSAKAATKARTKEVPQESTSNKGATVGRTVFSTVGLSKKK